MFENIASECFLEKFPQMNPIAAVGMFIKRLNPSEEINKRTELINSNYGTAFKNMPPLFNQMVLIPFSFF
jgi:hypothetical protein